MAYKNEQIENSLSYRITGKRAKRKSHVYEKHGSNKKLRQKMKNIDYVPALKQRNGWEF